MRDYNGAATKQDVANVEAWAEIIKNIVALMPYEDEIRNGVRRLAIDNEVAMQTERDKPLSQRDLRWHGDESWKNTPGWRHRRCIERLTSLVIQVLVRDIVNDHAPAQAAEILFAHQPLGHGSGLLGDYLDCVGLERVANAMGKACLTHHA
jgi:hypothetical protein